MDIWAWVESKYLIHTFLQASLPRKPSIGATKNTHGTSGESVMKVNMASEIPIGEAAARSGK